MKRMISVLSAGALLAMSSFAGATTDPTDMDPAMNGGVSSSGMYPNQAMEDAAVNTAAAWVDDQHALEPAINGGVSENGLYPSQAVQNAE